MGLRVCLVTPFAWSRPHDVNEHVAGLAAELRALGHSVTVLAPSTRAADLLAGRRALLDGDGAEVIALGPAVPVSRRSRIGVPVGVRANLALALARGGYDVVHGFEPGLPSLSYLALRDAYALTVATFLSVDRLGYPPGKPQRERLLSRIDALLATSEEVAQAAAVRLPGDYRIVSEGVDVELLAPGDKRNLVVLEWRATERPLTRSAVRAEAESFERVAIEHDAVYRTLARRRRRRDSNGDALADRDWIVCDLHMHTHWSHDCAMEVPDLLAHAEAEGLAAIAITDHNVFGGAQEAAGA